MTVKTLHTGPSALHAVCRQFQELKCNPPPPRQQPRQRAQHQNFLVSPPVDDGKKWRVLSAGVLERLPVVQPDFED
ncbi:hypothetical protein DVH05_005293 [Phytophthora capsici]|nr:hypothetical protein DVH05_005293 [Phytophthora capsici]